MPERRLLDQISDVARLRHLSLRTEKAYRNWAKRYIFFHSKRHPREMGGDEVVAFLTHLAVNEKVAASTQNQALNALLFLYRNVLKMELDHLTGAERALPSRHLPVVFTKEEAQAIIAHLKGENRLIVSLLYGSGLRIMEAVRLRVKDIDFERREIIIRDGKGERDRVTMLPNSVATALQLQIEGVKRLHEHDLNVAMARFICRTRWSGNTRTRAETLFGSICFRQRTFQSTREPKKRGDLISPKRTCNVRSSRR
jgi:integrase